MCSYLSPSLLICLPHISTRPLDVAVMNMISTIVVYHVSRKNYSDDRHEYNFYDYYHHHRQHNYQIHECTDEFKYYYYSQHFDQ